MAFGVSSLSWPLRRPVLDEDFFGASGVFDEGAAEGVAGVLEADTAVAAPEVRLVWLLDRGVELSDDRLKKWKSLI